MKKLYSDFMIHGLLVTPLVGWKRAIVHCNFDLGSNFMKSGVKLNGLIKEEEKMIKISYKRGLAKFMNHLRYFPFFERQLK